MFATVSADWNPHQKLEFAKVCIRTVVEQTQAERKRKEKSEEEEIDEELDTAIGKLSSGELIGVRKTNLLEHIEALRARKDQLINLKGERLAEKLGTKWYNEGEKSTKYFLRLLNRTVPDDFTSINNESGETSDPKEIEAEIVRYYKALYENYDKSLIEAIHEDDEFFAGLEKISQADTPNLTKEISLADLTKTLQSCRDSAPGPDGIPYSILGLLWPTYGQLLCEAWNYSLQIGKLPPSHKVSYLKLIPKVGKNNKDLTNWRPITLSNCDHKLITKTYANRMCELTAPVIKERQTAYLKGRLINDNIRSMLATINLTNLEEQARGLLVSIDARKAFDSVEHSYIERCLKELGCEGFIPIFRTLYSELTTDIIINGKIVKGFSILRGVKQGDSLSCILFIICMEPLLRNIESNHTLEAIKTEKLGDLPKAYAYADDINCTIKDSQESLQIVFAEYEKLSRRSGLILNAGKTEVMTLGSSEPKSFRIRYLGRTFKVDTKEKIKINGIQFQRDAIQMAEDNVKNSVQKMDKYFRSWSRRSLSTLGKILIVKCFAISQIIYLMQSFELKNVHYKAVNNLIYKFIWNRHYLASKAPERIKREIMNKPIKLGGYGMLDVACLDDSFKIRAIGRLSVSKHPFLQLLRAKCGLENFFEPECPIGIESVASRGVELLKQDRTKLWDNPNLSQNLALLRQIRLVPIARFLNREGLLSIVYFSARTRGARLMGDLTNRELTGLTRFIDRRKLDFIINAVNLPRTNVTTNISVAVHIKGRFKEILACTSKEIRESRTSQDPVTNLRIGALLSTAEALSWGYKLSRLTSVKHRNTILKTAHGEIYTKEKLHRFGLADSSSCPRCGQVETLEHKMVDCDYISRIWACANTFIERLTNLNQVDKYKAVVGGQIESTLTTLTINAEILQRIMYLREGQNYLMRPKIFVLNCLRALAVKERYSIANEIKALLNEQE